MEDVCLLGHLLSYTYLPSRMRLKDERCQAGSYIKTIGGVDKVLVGQAPRPVGLVGAGGRALGALVIISGHETRHAIPFRPLTGWAGCKMQGSSS